MLVKSSVQPVTTPQIDNPGCFKCHRKVCDAFQNFLLPYRRIISVATGKSYKITPYNVGSVLRRLFSTVEAVQYCGGIASVHVGDSISTAEAVQYCGGIASVLRGIASVLWRNSISTVEAVQYCGGIAAVHVGDSVSTVEAIEYCGGIAAVLQGG